MTSIYMLEGLPGRAVGVAALSRQVFSLLLAEMSAVYSTSCISFVLLLTNKLKSMRIVAR